MEKIAAIKDRIHHQVTVNDLFFLKRGGRIDAATAKLDELNYVFISHSDCLEDVESLAAMIKEEWNTEVIIGDIGPVIGAHTGPGAIALCYLGANVKGE